MKVSHCNAQVNRVKDKHHTVILIDVEKLLDKIHSHYKDTQQITSKGNYFKIIRLPVKSPQLTYAVVKD